MCGGIILTISRVCRSPVPLESWGVRKCGDSPLGLSNKSHTLDVVAEAQSAEPYAREFLSYVVARVGTPPRRACMMVSQPPHGSAASEQMPTSDFHVYSKP